jgi:hypothetical protein
VSAIRAASVLSRLSRVAGSGTAPGPGRRANGQGRNWARILSTVLVVLATLQLRGAFTRLVSHAGFGVTVLYYDGAVLFVAAWLAGGAAVWLLWRPASTAFFKPPGSAQALHQAHMAELDRLRSSRARSPRQV